MPPAELSIGLALASAGNPPLTKVAHMSKSKSLLIVALLGLSACGASASQGQTRTTLCGAAATACALVQGYCAASAANGKPVLDPADEATN